MKLLIEVTEEDIKRAIAYRKRDNNVSTTCPVALAVKRAIDHKGIAVGMNSIHTSMRASQSIGSLPEKACKFIRTFDSHGDVEPIKFEAEFPLREESIFFP